MRSSNACSVSSSYPVRVSNRESSQTESLQPPPSEGRRRIMQGNRSRDTGPEILLRRSLREAGLLGYRLHRRGLPGSPDITFGPSKVAVFVDGCFWHGCPKCYRAPKTRSAFWRNRVETNRARDVWVTGRLEEAGWAVVRSWECELKEDPAALASAVLELVTKRRSASATGRSSRIDR